MNLEKIVNQLKVPASGKINLAKDYDPEFTAGYQKDDLDFAKLLEEAVEQIAAYQEKLYAENRQALLVVIQALDAAGKDSAIAYVFSGVNPAGFQVSSFKAPSAEELDHDYLWRCVKALPERGRIGIFNRSHYEEVLPVRVHPSFLPPQRLPAHTLGEGLWKQRFEEINNWEKYLVHQGTEIVKIYLNVSKEEQRQQQLERIDTPEKNWKFNAGDIEERKYWDQYMQAYDDIFENTSTPWAPWYIVPADRRWFTRLALAAVIVEKLKAMDPKFPKVDEKNRPQMLEARTSLMTEGK
jgi:PPK2 family polyphosphate:nucleotide phosphotransferase